MTELIIVFLGVAVSIYTNLENPKLFSKKQYEMINKFHKNRNAEILELKQGVNECMAAESSCYSMWKLQESAEYKNYRKKIESEWGQCLKSTKKRWVHYDTDLKSRCVVDFERGIVSVEVIKESNENSQGVRNRLETAVTKLLTYTKSNKKGDECVRVLENQIINKDGKRVDEKSAQSFVSEIINQDQMTDDNLAKVCFSLAPDHICQRARKVLPYVLNCCRKYNLNYSLVMATIHTESYFNPMARSSCNALGLMQLVAQTAGREAFKFVYGYDKIPQPETLYDPQKNILLGCAYLYILKNKYFSNIANIRSKLYCIIAGYNTGPGNVAFAFTGKKELLSASQVINDIMEPDSVYFLLQSGLPYYETRIYLKNVLGKMQLYSFPKIQIPSGGQL